MGESRHPDPQDGAADPREFTLLRSRYVDALLRGDEETARSTIYRAIALNWGPEAVYLDLLGASLVRVGDMWARGDATVANEHQATQFTLREMTSIRQFFDSSPDNGLRAVVASIEGEQHSVGSLMVADFLRLDGWTVDYLGPDIPLPDMVNLAITRQHDFAGLSVTIPDNLPKLRETVGALREAVPGMAVMVGGQATVSEAANVPGRWGADALGTDPIEAAAVAPGLVNGRADAN